MSASTSLVHEAVCLHYMLTIHAPQEMKLKNNTFSMKVKIKPNLKNEQYEKSMILEQDQFQRNL